ncbi:hypothetical protein DSO57_1033395 [Entomophthora muscae]|uniref:Uncharacterized protein n=1 Tax=Entomophthora muscae TaxID=34485 RepID=A0ACC2REX7_9FUNG|nr:hypothetical protein DSO57_1033395 [Entomophthora muscae]
MEIFLVLPHYATQVSSETMISLSVPFYPSLEKTKSHLHTLLPNLQASHKDCFHLANTTRSFSPSSQDYEPLILRLEASTRYTSISCSRLEERFASLPTKSSEEGTITSSPTVDQKTTFYQPALSPSVPLLFNKTSTITLLSLSNTSKSPTVLVTIHGPLGKIKVLALPDTDIDANFIEEKLANLIGLPTFGLLDVKVENSTLPGVTPILQLVNIDLEGSPFCNMCNSSPNLSFLSSLDSLG